MWYGRCILAKSLGVCQVHVICYLDGKVSRTYYEHRVVYKRADGTYEVNYLQGRRTVACLGGTDFVHKQYVTSVKKVKSSLTLADFKGKPHGTA